jgi:L-ascorbate metabolism protein UlaG (beta-lactamase superfamily)
VNISLEWLGVATFRLRIDDLVVFLDAYMDRVPSAPAIGLASTEVDRADFVLAGHSHFDHLHGAQHIAKNTGATIVGSHETCRVMREHGVAKEQLRAVQGGERHRLADGVTARVFPSLHSCTWSAGTVDLDEELHGDLGLAEDERSGKRGGLVEAIRRAMAAGDEQAIAIRDHLATAAGSVHSGGALVYLIETPAGAIFYQDTSGCWSGVLRGLRPDVAILAAVGRANLDGEPFQGSLARFVAQEATLLQPKTVIICHQDDWMPPVTRDTTDLSPVRRELNRVLPGAQLLEMEYLAATPLYAGAKV